MRERGIEDCCGLTEDVTGDPVWISGYNYRVLKMVIIIVRGAPLASSAECTVA